MKILKLDVAGFRSLKCQTWTPGDLNLLIGPNGSGKSNLLHVLEMLQAAATGRLGRYVQQEGGMEPLAWDGSHDPIRVRAKMSPIPPYDDSVKDSLTYELALGRIGRSSAFRVAQEVLGNFYQVEQGAQTEPYKLLERSPQGAAVYDTDGQRFAFAAEKSVSDEETLLSAAAGPFTRNPFVGQFQRELSLWTVHQDFHTHREAEIRGPAVARNETRLDPDGRNLISVLHTLYASDRDFKSEVNKAMQAAFGDDFDELDFPPAADQRIELRLRWKSLRRPHSAADLSDGMLRFLFLLTALANPSPPALIAIDEPETGLNPSMLPIVAEHAVEASRRTQVVLTTHSPEFLDAFHDTQPTTTAFEWREGQTAVKVLSGDALAYWLQNYTLGELYRSKELEAIEP